jgi:hypothetical protein
VNPWLPRAEKKNFVADTDIKDGSEAAEADAELNGESSSTTRTVCDSLKDFNDLDLPCIPLSQFAPGEMTEAQAFPFRRHIVPLHEISTDTDTADEGPEVEDSQQIHRSQEAWFGGEMDDGEVEARQAIAEKRPSDGVAVEGGPSQPKIRRRHGPLIDPAPVTNFLRKRSVSFIFY